MRLFEISSDEYINQTLKQFFVKYGPSEIVNGVVNVDGSLKLTQKTYKLPITFGKVEGNIDFKTMALKTLVGSPREVNGVFYVDGNPLTSLEGGPDIVKGDYSCMSCILTSLKGAPREVDGFFCRENQLTSFEGGPEIVNGDLMAYHNPFTSLKGLPKRINGEIKLTPDKELPLLRLLYIKDLREITFGGYNNMDEGAEMHNIQIIINKYLRQGAKGAIKCAAELTRAGFKKSARL